MKIDNKAIIIAAVVILAVMAYAYFTAAPAPNKEKIEALAICLGEKNTTMYGAFWCPHCNAQKKSFGDSWSKIKYVECSEPDGNSETAQCKAAGIVGYPTWEFANGERVEGEVSFKELAQRSGCQYNESK
ncbi:hypothetical protein HY990_01490 [Candidatus Micrarchaeota archaeon]|nr:hypothetical protein [Candidatus Micrarchaeota archaeon]